jgi:hypothetical protein
LPLCREDLHRELEARRHDLICKRGVFTWLLGPNHGKALQSYDELKNGAHYVTARSTKQAHRIHLENLERGVLDWGPLLVPLNIALVMFGTSAIINSIVALLKAVQL